LDDTNFHTRHADGLQRGADGFNGPGNIAFQDDFKLYALGFTGSSVPLIFFWTQRGSPLLVDDLRSLDWRKNSMHVMVFFNVTVFTIFF